MYRAIVGGEAVYRGGCVLAPHGIVAVQLRVPLVCVPYPHDAHVLVAHVLCALLPRVDGELLRPLLARVAHGAASPLPLAVSAPPPLSSFALFRYVAFLPLLD